MCILSSCKPLFATWSAFSLPGIPVWGYPVNSGPMCSYGCRVSDAPRNSSVSYCLVCSQLSNSVCVLSLVSLASSCARRIAVSSASSTDANSFNLMIIYSSLCTISPATVT